ncbi:hypothetical protein DB346_25065 [Verrucomicrobia bacterium LW23]|nr:hypothetical protein DB346_25065 [Verrucomicrobia bacterium LW23]
MHIRLKRRAAFSLIELVVVLGIALLLAAITVPMFRNMGASGMMFNRAVMEIKSMAESARQTANTQNTCTWLALGSVAEPNGERTLYVAVFLSKDGTDPNPWGDYGAVPSDTIGLAVPVRHFKQVLLGDAASITSAEIPGLPANPVVTAANSLSDNTAVFTYTSAGQTVTFNRAIQFTPTGEARTSAAMTQVTEFALQPQRGNTPAGDVDKAAVFRISGISGACNVYRK